MQSDDGLIAGRTFRVVTRNPYVMIGYHKFFRWGGDVGEWTFIRRLRNEPESKESSAETGQQRQGC